MYKMPFRQIHLDFHTGEQVPGVGENFDKKQFQEALKLGHVNSINLFAKCHHGWMYYTDAPTAKHPHLTCDLTREMVAACKEIGVRTQIYISAGLDEYMAKQHPEWLFRHQNQSTTWASDFMQAGYHMLCMNTSYLDYLIEQIEHVVKTFDTDGIWLDIVGVRGCYCSTCMQQLMAEGKNPREEKDVVDLGERVYKNYLERVEKAIHAIKPEMEIFQNSGHVARGRRDIMDYYSHIELESLPTGGWGYDHFPLSARYVQGFGKEFLGMTGKFHTTWGEFGGFKHPNALRYEAALNLANGAKISIGDQMHPDGLMDLVTYGLIGEAYKEVEQKEAWCSDVVNVADVALLTQESVKGRSASQAQAGSTLESDAGAVRMLIEGKYLFDVIDDQEEQLERYQVIVLPDSITLDEGLKVKLKAYVAKGGKILATGKSGLDVDQKNFELDFGVSFVGESEFKPDYFIPAFSYKNLGSTAFVMYSNGYKIEQTDGVIIGEREDSYFNRDFDHFSSHFHTPNEKGKRSPGISEGKDGIYISWEIFDDYARKGSLILKEIFKNAMDRLLGDNKTLATNLGAQGVATVQCQKEEQRYINHLLYAVPTRRGGGVEIIEDIVPLLNTTVTLKVDKKIKSVYLAPQMTALDFVQEGDKITYTVDQFECHQMIVAEYQER